MGEQQAPVVFVALGPPGAGKGTQSGMLAGLLRIPHISVGNLLRSHAEDKSEVGLRLRGMMALGTLVPDTLVLDVLATRISELDCARGLILDGSALTIREDDRIATVLKRLRIYEQETAPILSHYAGKASLLEVDGEQPKEDIAQEIVTAIQSMLRISTASAKNVQSMVENNP